MQGDTLVTRCVDHTIGRDFPTLVSSATFSIGTHVQGGYGIEDEMCVDYIHYYPLAKLEVCKTAVANSSLHDWFRNVAALVK